MTNCIDAAMDHVQPTARERPPDRVTVQPGTEELRPRQNAVLAECEEAKNLVNGLVLSSTAYIRLN